MEKVRFEAFNVEELRVLRRACYEAGAAFGDPGLLKQGEDTQK